MKILAIDQGTTSTRGLVVDTDGEVTLCHAIKHKQFYPNDGWVEHDALEIIENIIQCIKLAGSNIDAIALDNQGESCLAWDGKTKEPISPIIVWQDKRSEGAIQKLKDAGYENEVKKITGLPLDSYFSASKLAWIFDNIPQAKKLHQENRLRLGTTDAYFLDKLSNEFVTDITTASRTSLMDISTGQWDESLCQLFNVPIDALPKIVPSVGDFGSTTVNGKAIPINVSIVDQQSSLFGHGCHQIGDVKMTFGTGAFILVITGNKINESPENGLLPTIAWQLNDKKNSIMYALDGGVYCAASALNWAKSIGLFEQFDDINHFGTNDEVSSSNVSGGTTSASAISRNLVFIPALVGLACPHWSRKTSGSWLGLKIDTSAKDMVQAVLEGVAFRASEVLNLMAKYESLSKQISIDGGLSANDYFCQFLANINNKEIYVQQTQELTALGGAMLVAEYYDKKLKDLAQIKIYKPTEDWRHLILRFNQAIALVKQW